MAGRGRAPKDPTQRINDHAPERGEIQTATAAGWQHGKVPAPPAGLMPATQQAWKTWMKAWFAAFWSPDDLPGLNHMILLYDQVQRGEFQRSAELRLTMDTYGVTPKGQQDRRWRPPVKESKPAAVAPGRARYGGLRVVDDAVESA